MKKNQKRLSMEQARVEMYQVSQQAGSENPDDGNDNEAEGMDGEFLPPEFQDADFDPGPSNDRDTKIDYDDAIEFAIRSGLSDRIITGFLNNVLKCLKKANLPITKAMFVCRNTVRNLKSRAEKQATKDQAEHSQFVCLKFDGRCDAKTLVTPNKKAKEEHVTVIAEPEYVDHFTPKNGKSATLADELKIVVSENESSSSLKVIGADGTNVNTGEKGGAIKLLEDKLDRPLFWDICMLHFNELPFRHLFEFLDGKYKGPGVYEGPVGKEIVACNKDGWNVPVKFQSLSEGKVQKLPDQFLTALSHDQRYLYDICHAVQEGSLPEVLVERPPGKVHQARWVTMANCILRLFVQTKKPSKKLLRLSKIIVQYYAPTFFEIKQNWHITQGPKNFFFALDLARSCLLKKEFAVAKKIFQINSYFAHPEAILLSALSDSDLNVRAWSADYILKDRAVRETRDFRTYKLQKLNFEAKSYLDLLGKDFENVRPQFITEPPLTFDVSDSELLKCCLGKDLQFPEIPCHSQNVERAVACTTKVAETVVGYEKRHSHILLLNKSRQKLSKDANKTDYMK